MESPSLARAQALAHDTSLLLQAATWGSETSTALSRGVGAEVLDGTGHLLSPVHILSWR